MPKRFEGERLRRVAWKIVRGLYFHHHGTVLDADIPHGLRMLAPEDEPPFPFGLIPDLDLGQYPGVFDYRFAVFPSFHFMNVWGLLLWDRIIMVVTFHDPACDCEACVTRRTTARRHEVIA
jgi:hypothetical protein